VLKHKDVIEANSLGTISLVNALLSSNFPVTKVYLSLRERSHYLDVLRRLSCL